MESNESDPHGLMAAAGLTPAERNGHGSDRRAAALGEIHKIRKHVASPIGDPAAALAALDRLQAIIRSMP